MLRINNSACQYLVYKDNIPVSALCFGFFIVVNYTSIKLTTVNILKCTVQWHSLHPKCYATIITILLLKLFYYPKPSKYFLNYQYMKIVNICCTSWLTLNNSSGLNRSVNVFWFTSYPT